MADIPSSQHPDLVGAMRLVIIGVMHLGQAMEQYAASASYAADGSMRRAQDALAKAGMLLDVSEQEVPPMPIAEPTNDPAPEPSDPPPEPPMAA